jgi:hypothetical protein
MTFWAQNTAILAQNTAILAQNTAILAQKNEHSIGYQDSRPVFSVETSLVLDLINQFFY